MQVYITYQSKDPFVHSIHMDLESAIEMADSIHNESYERIPVWVVKSPTGVFRVGPLTYDDPDDPEEVQLRKEYVLYEK